MIIEAPVEIFALEFLQGYDPVNKAYLLGLHVADEECPFVNLMPSFAILSMLGVFSVP